MLPSDSDEDSQLSDGHRLPTGDDQTFSDTVARESRGTAIVNPPAPRTSSKTEVLVTYDKHVLKHEISDETLGRLQDGNHSFYFDVFLAALAAAIASAPSGIERWVTLTTKPVPGALSPVDLIILMTPIASAIVAVLFGWLWRREGGSIRKLVQSLRDRPTKAGR